MKVVLKVKNWKELTRNRNEWNKHVEKAKTHPGFLCCRRRRRISKLSVSLASYLSPFGSGFFILNLVKISDFSTCATCLAHIITDQHYLVKNANLKPPVFLLIHFFPFTLDLRDFRYKYSPTTSVVPKDPSTSEALCDFYDGLV